MPDPAGIQQIFLDHLDVRDIPHTVHPHGVEVHRNLNLQQSSLHQLPKGLTVWGDLNLARTHLAQLPEHLVVHGHLGLDSTPITALPASLSVAGDIRLEDTQIAALPAGFQAPAHLLLRQTPITELPEGLCVGKSLDLRGTQIRRLPPGLHVGDMILPPNDLEDITAFIKKHPDQVALRYPESHHERLALRAQLHATPDLWCVVEHLSPGLYLSLRRFRNGYWPVVRRMV